MDVGKVEVQPLWYRDDWVGDLPASLQRQLKTQRHIPILIASCNHAIIGWSNLSDRSNRLLEFYVKPEHRRSGIGSRLFRCTVSLMLDYGASEVCLPPKLTDSPVAQQFLNSIHAGEKTSAHVLSLTSWMQDFQQRIQHLQKTLNIPLDYGISRGLRLHKDADELTEIGLDCWQRPQQMLPRAAAAWTLMQHSADNDNVSLMPVSAFRSIDYQSRLIKRKLDAGQNIENILKVSAAPGFSEHHTGRAIDITDGICAPLENEFAECKAFQWLKFNAEDFDFHLSYPQDNPYGIIWEPWHWCWREN
ncbi:MAG: GNAT family N-acetyltransferase [Xanthomonadales bacterium]|nr:GNAT family N-acetyltransferase [Xanthomonadales bacterium]